MSLPSITESPIASEMLTHIELGIQNGLRMLDHSAQDEPVAIVKSVNEYVFSMQRGDVSPTDEDADLNLGCLWGHQMVRQFNWQWAEVVLHDHDNAKTIGVFSPDRGLAIYPLNFVSGCLENGLPVTILLAFNMLNKSDRMPSIASGSYKDVMGMVHHIIPPT